MSTAPWPAPSQASNENQTQPVISNEQLLETWYDCQRQLTNIKENEMILRKQVVARFFDPADAEGTKRYALPGGYQLKVVKKQTYKVSNEDHKLEHALFKLPDAVSALLVSWLPTLSVSNYKRLDDESKAIFNDCLTITDGAPTLEIEQPKVK